MDPSSHHTVGPDQLPDENYIERLFPKCPPKSVFGQANSRQRQSSSATTNRSNAGGQTTPATRRTRKARTKIQQHSRRELEARRVKSNNNNKNSSQNNISQENNNNNNNTSDSSDNETVGRLKFSGLRRTNSVTKSTSSVQQQHGGTSSSLDLQQQQQSPNQSTTTMAPSGQPKRRAGKYMASQNLLKQLQRSQSGNFAPALFEAKNNNEVSNSTRSLNSSTSLKENLNQSANISVVGANVTAASNIIQNSNDKDPPRSPTDSLVAKVDRRNNRLRANLIDKTDNSQIITNEHCANMSTVAAPIAPQSQPPLSSQIRHATNNSEHSSRPSTQNTAVLSGSKTNLLCSINEEQNNKPNQLQTDQRASTSPDKQPIYDCNGETNNNILNDQRDEDKYINLFVYDNNNHAQQQRHDIKVLDNQSHTNLSKEEDHEELTKKSDINSNIVSVQNHQASHQLSISDTNDNDDEGVIRNDTSTEELCSVGDMILDNAKKGFSVKKEVENYSLVIKKRPPNLDATCPPPTAIKSTNSSSHQHLLETVDEKAEINIDESAGEVIENQDPDKNHPECVNDIPKMQHNNCSNQSSKIKKGFVPPGFPQRVRPQPAITSTNQSTNESPTLSLIENRNNELANSSTSDKPISSDSDVGSNHDASLKLNVVKAESQRVRFDQAQTASPKRDDANRLSPSRTATIDGTHLVVATAPPGGRRVDHSVSQMPSISEAQIESDADLQVTKNDNVDRELCSAMNDVTLSTDHNGPNLAPVTSCSNNSSGVLVQQQQQHGVTVNQVAIESQPQSLQYTTGPDSKSSTIEAKPLQNLRHHKLPNESSHYSIVRSNNSVVAINDTNVPSRSSSIQFNNFSDGESGPDDHNSGPSELRQTGSHRSFAMPKKSDPTNSSRGPSVSSSSGRNDDDFMPTTKTALIFPRLDEGLSSGAESCEDEVEDDDDRAMEADVDADDDEDDDDDDLDDDISGPNVSVNRAGQSLQSSVDCFLRQQQPVSKPPNRIIGSLQQQQQQQHGSNLVDLQTDSDMNQMKASGPGYSGFVNHDSLDQNDLKSIPTYSNQNGQSNYWMGPTNMQPNTMSSQPSSSQHFSIQRSHTNNNNSNSNSNSSNNNINNNNNSGNIQRGNNSFNWEEAKGTNRLSSDTDNETDRLLGSQRNDPLNKLTNNDINSNNSTDLQPNSNFVKQNTNSREVLIEGVLFNVKYLGSTHTDCEGRGEKEDRIHQAEMAVHEVKFRNGESQSVIEVQLFISTEKIMVLDDKNRKIMMDHSLRTISYIADIGDAIVLIVRKKSTDSTNELGRPTSKISCHVFESSESHTITKSISQAFQVAYTELLKANGVGDMNNYLPKELDYQEVLNSQEMSTAELEMFARKDNQREVIVPKKKGEILGLSIVESGWGSALPTAVIASLKQDGPAYKCKKLSVGDQILSINGISLVGLSLGECQEILRKTKRQTVARLSVVPCPITVEVKIKRPDTKYQLGFSVQNGVICSLLRGGIAERGGVRVGHRIMSINGTTVVNVPHDKIVTLLASSVGEIRMKTCLTSLYRHMLGEEKAVFL